MASAKRPSNARRSDGHGERADCCSWLVRCGGRLVSIRRLPFPVWKPARSSLLTETRGRYQPETHSIECRLCTALHAEFDQNIADVGLDGLLTQREVMSDLFI